MQLRVKVEMRSGSGVGRRAMIPCEETRKKNFMVLVAHISGFLPGCLFSLLACC